MVNRAYCIAIGDHTQPIWAEAPDWQKDSAINGVVAALANPAATPADSHAGWLKQKLAEGWKYGAVKNVEAKEHPCCVPYEQLPPAQQKKDSLFLATVRAVAAELGA